MSTTQPIRNKELLEDFKDYYKTNKYNLRNYTLIMLGLNSALRINDILHIKHSDIFYNKRIKEYIIINEHKTHKENQIYLNDTIREVLSQYHEYLVNLSVYKEGNPYLFPSLSSKEKPLSRCQAYRIIKKAAENVGLEEHISCHSLRKTFGYHAWKQGYDPIIIMTIFNHSSLSITKRYLCVQQDDKDSVFKKINI